MDTFQECKLEMISLKWNIIWQIHLSLSLSFLPLFYFSRRNYRETSALLVCCSGSRLYFQQCVTRHALTPAVYFCNVYSPCKNKKDSNAGTAGCRGGSRMRGIIPTTAKECHFKELCEVSLFYYHEVGARGKKDRLWIFSFAWQFLFANVFRKIAKKIDSPTLSRWFLICIICVYWDYTL